MRKVSAGLLMYKFDSDGKLKVFLVHPGGPFWKDKEDGAWSIPKGERDSESDNLIDVAIREMKEETGIIVGKGENFIELNEITQKSGKVVYAWAFEGDWSGLLMCQSFAEVEWPLHSGRKIKVPEVDKAGFFSLDIAKKKIKKLPKIRYLRSKLRSISANFFASRNRQFLIRIFDDAASCGVLNQKILINPAQVELIERLRAKI